MTSHDPDRPSSGSDDRWGQSSWSAGSADDWGSAAARQPAEEANPWSAASGAEGLGGPDPEPEPEPAPPSTPPAGSPGVQPEQPTAPFPAYPSADATTGQSVPPPLPQTTPLPPTSAPSAASAPYDPYPASDPYAAPGYDPSGYPQPGYSQPGYAPSGYPQPGSAQSGYSAPEYGQYPPTPYGQEPAAQPYGQMSYGPQGGYPGYGPVNPYQSVGMTVNHPQAVLALVLGILGVTCLWGVASIPALILGRKVTTDCDREPGRWAGRGMGTAGFVLGIVGIIGGALWLISTIAGVASS